MAKRSMADAIKGFKEWRRVRGGPTSATPVRLRKLAVALSAQEGEEAVRKKLGLSSSQLWEWRKEHRPARGKVRSGRLAKKSVGAVERLKFLEVAPQLVQVHEGSISVEWSRADGSRMKLSGVSPEAAKELSAQFLRDVRP